MVARNDITGDAIQTKGTSQAFRDNYDLIFGKKNKKKSEELTIDQDPVKLEEQQTKQGD